MNLFHHVPPFYLSLYKSHFTYSLNSKLQLYFVEILKHGCKRSGRLINNVGTKQIRDTYALYLNILIFLS